MGFSTDKLRDSVLTNYGIQYWQITGFSTENYGMFFGAYINLEYNVSCIISDLAPAHFMAETIRH